MEVHSVGAIITIVALLLCLSVLLLIGIRHEVLWLVMKKFEVKSMGRQLKALRLNLLLEASKIALASVYDSIYEKKILDIHVSYNKFLHDMIKKAQTLCKLRLSSLLRALETQERWPFKLQVQQVEIRAIKGTWTPSEADYEKYLKTLGISFGKDNSLVIRTYIRILASLRNVTKARLDLKFDLPIKGDLELAFNARDYVLEQISNKLSSINGSHFSSIEQLKSSITSIVQDSFEDAQEILKVDLDCKYYLELIPLYNDATNGTAFEVRIVLLQIRVRSPRMNVFLLRGFRFTKESYAVKFFGKVIFKTRVFVEERNEEPR